VIYVVVAITTTVVVCI